MATPANWEYDNEWELINDGGFVYKRRKRPVVGTVTASAPPLPDPAAEEMNRLERKKRALLKLKYQYQQEIDQWVHLSNDLEEMQQKSLISSQQQEYRELNDDTTSFAPFTTASLVPPVQSSEQLVYELLLQAEAQRCIVEDVERLCYVAEALCSAREESFKKSFTELPIWESKPHELVMSLYED